MTRITLLTLGFIICLTLSAQEFDYLPAKVGDNQIIAYTQFTLSYNNEHEQADWVAYELTKAEVEMDLDRCNCFEEDDRVKGGSAIDEDYSSTGFDRGHLSPAADNNMSERANRESFLFSNMSPQLPYFNQNVWVKLEKWVREKAIENDKIFVVTGGVFVNSFGKVGINGVTIPSHFYKVLLRFKENGNPTLIGFLIPHLVPNSADFKDYIVPVNTIETITGLDFFPAIENREEFYEAILSKEAWGLD